MDPDDLLPRLRMVQCLLERFPGDPKHEAPISVVFEIMSTLRELIAELEAQKRTADSGSST